jgi:mannose-6-phosphate isomerase-like protein (cupin superfamily)
VLGEHAIQHLRPAEFDPPLVVDALYPGDSDSRHGTVYATPDGVLEVGVWRLDGSHTTPVHEGYEEVLVLLEGALHVECEGTNFEVVPGEVLVYDCPVPPQRVTGRSAVALYVMRHRRPAPSAGEEG